MKKLYRTSELSIVKDIVFSAFKQLEEKIDCRIPKGFFIILMLFLGIKGRINFLQLERFSNRCESGFRYFFEKRFNFMKFNQVLTKLHIKGKTALAFDPSYISKAGKKTPGLGYFWSGCAGKAKWGLEFCGFAVIDISRRTAFHLTGFQTIDLMEDETLLDFYCRKIIEMKDELLKTSQQETPFSMSDIKTHYYNELLLNRFIAMFGINPELDKNKHKIKQFLDFGKIAA